MSNFNELLKRDGIKTIVTRFFNKVDSFNTKYSITDLDYKIKEQPSRPAAYYIENSLTASHLIELSYRLNDEPEVKYATFEIPKEIDGAFIIGGAYRIATNKLDGDFDCRIRMSDVGDQYINFDYNRKYDIKKGVLKIKRQNELNPTVSERAIEIKYEDIDKLTGEKKEQLKLTDTQIKKFQIKLDLDYTPEYISTNLIDDCLAFGDDRLKDLIIDKRIDSVYTSFMNFLFRSSNGSNYISARRRITGYFTKYNKIQEEVTAITTLAFRFFKGTQESKGDSNLQVPPGINAINLDSLGNKIQVSETTAYNATFADLIDLADTPINNNANKQNALTVSTHITDDGVMFDVYDKEFNKITISYIDYLNSKVCASEFVDYDKKILKPNESGQVEVKYRMKRRMVNVDDIDLIDLHPDYRLSSTTRRIPFINSTDSVRISMGTAMLKILSNNIVICYVHLVKCWKPLKINYSSLVTYDEKG